MRNGGVQQDISDTHSMNFFDFERLDAAYRESSKFLQSTSVTRCLSWIVKNYASIVAGKYKDFDVTRTNNRIVTDYSADELNKVFEKLNEDL